MAWFEESYGCEGAGAGKCDGTRGLPSLAQGGFLDLCDDCGRCGTASSGGACASDAGWDFAYGGLDAVFASHAALTLAHILPAMAFVLLTPLVLSRRSGALWAERLFFPLGAVVGVTAYAMSVYSVGGWVERSAVLFFNSLFLFSLARAYGFMRRGEGAEKIRWTLRAVGILLGIATTRPVMGVFFATSKLTHLEPSQFFGIAFWIGFSINTIAIELWLRSRGHWAAGARMAHPGS